jgi:hypothetical protein
MIIDQQDANRHAVFVSPLLHRVNLFKVFPRLATV